MRNDFPDAPLGRDFRNESLWGSMVAGWNRFWFTPSDPTLLGLIRICTGLLAMYTIFVYTFDLQVFMGKDAWMSLELRGKNIRQSPGFVDPLQRTPPTTPELWLSLKLTTDQYTKIGVFTEGEKKYPPPQTLEEWKLKKDQIDKIEYIRDYHKKWGREPPMPFPKNDEEAEAIDQYIRDFNVDPRILNFKGTSDWTIWMHVTDPESMLTVHALFGLAAFLFTIGFATRITSVLTWFASMNYVHRSSISIFGFDTMMIILLIYLMIGPSGAALSVDRLIARWWRRRRDVDQLHGSAKVSDFFFDQSDPPRPSISCNVAMRLLQIHVCFIYAAAGLSKLQGAPWWSGNAIWGTISNTEFAPIQSPIYMFLLRNLAANQVLLESFMAAGTYFTLFFEIAYPFMIWGKRTRWLMLAMAVVLHGLIGMLMGLKTFALVMLVMNAAFLPRETVQWLLGMFLPVRKGAAPPDQKTTLALAGQSAGAAGMAATAAREASVSTKVKAEK